MAFLSFLWEQVRKYAAYAAAAVVVYWTIRSHGTTAQKAKQAEIDAEEQEKRADFYKNMDEANAEIDRTTPDDRDDLIKRLLGPGL